VHVILSCAISVDGYLDDASDTRLVLSNEEDLARVHDVRAGVDAIMVGANTIRRDNPRLLVRDSMYGPTKVTVTASGDVDPASRFFTVGNAAKLVYAPTPTAGPLRDRLRDLATVIDCGPTAEPPWILDDLAARGVNRLMVEGGGTLLTQFLTAGLADELQLAVAPLLVGDPRAPRFVHDGHFDQPMILAEVRQLGEIVVLRYLFGRLAEDWRWLSLAFELSHLCPPSTTALNVGAVIVDADGQEISRGYSRDTDDKVHAEESALSKVDSLDPRLKTATVYSSIEPCGKRASRPRTCARLIVEAGIRRVVFGLREPPTFVDGEGAEILAEAGVEVVELGAMPG
jgi:5-amino-6-(5-phosphoribosylamino)uracil reductase